MITWNEIRELSAFDSFFSSQTESTSYSYSDNPVEYGDLANSALSLISYQDGITSTIVSNSFTQMNISPGETGTQIGAGGSTTISNATMSAFTETSFSAGTTIFADTSTTDSASYSSSQSTTFVYGFDFVTSTTTTYSSTLVTTSNVDTTTLSYYIPSGESVVSTSSISTNCASNAYSSTIDYGGGVTGTIISPVTTSFSSTCPTNSFSSSTSSTYVELGTVVSANGSDYLWSFTANPAGSPAFNSSQQFATDIAVSFTQATFWPQYEGRNQHYAGYVIGDSATFVTAGELITGTYNILTATSTDSSSIRLTGQDYFPISTVGTTFSDYSLSTSTYTYGGGTTVFPVFNTSDVYTVNSTCTELYTDSVVILVPVGFENSSTTTATTTYSRFASAVGYSFAPEYLSFSDTAIEAEGITSSEAFGCTVAGTTQISVAIGSYLPGFFQSNITPVAPFNAILAPQDIKGANFAFDLSIGSEIYYPLTASVLRNAMTPLAVNNTETRQGNGGKSETWIYGFASGVISSFLFTSGISSTYASGDYSLVTYSTIASSGTFTPENASTFCDSYGLQSGWGGFGGIPGHIPTVYVSPGAFQSTHIPQSGTSTSSSNVILTSSSSYTVSGALDVWQTVCAPITYTLEGSNIPLLTFQRN